MSIRLGTTDPSSFRLGSTAVSKIMLGNTEVWSSAFDPLSLSPALWLDASDASTLFDATTGGSLVAANGAIARFEDKSGNGRHFTQGTLANRPIRKVANQNSKDEIYFDGLNDFLTCISGFSFTSVSIFAVARVIAATNNDDGNVFYYGNSNFYIPQYNWVGVGKAYRLSKWVSGNYNNPTERSVTSSYDVSTTAHQLACGIVNDSGGKTRLFLNGSETGIATTSVEISISSSARATLGCRGQTTASPPYTQGYIAEVLVYPSALSSTNRQAVESYLNAKWAIY